jgi:hypothetical protein
VRLLIGIAVTLVALSGCGDSAEATWPGPPTPEADGSVDVDGFAAHQESTNESWEASTVLAAAEFLNLGERVAANKSIQAAGPSESDGPEAVLVLLDGLPDESVQAERWRLEFEPAADGFRLAAASRALRCQAGRGHEDFAPEPCE